MNDECLDNGYWVPDCEEADLVVDAESCDIPTWPQWKSRSRTEVYRGRSLRRRIGVNVFGFREGEDCVGLDDSDDGESWLVLKSAFLSRFYIIILHLKYQ